MSERLMPQPSRPRGLDARSLRRWGWLCLAAGIAGQTIIQDAILGVTSSNFDQLFQALADDKNMILATVALMAQLAMTCAVPIFTFLLVQGLLHTSSFKDYFLRVLGLAALSEIPYNLAMCGKLIDLGSRNPVFGLVLAMAMIHFFRQYGGKSLKGIAVSVMVVVVSMLWVGMLHISDGMVVVLLATVLWLTRKKHGMQTFAGASVTLLCTILSPMYFVAPMAFLLIHFYNGEPDDGNRWVRYLAYPVMLLGLFLIGRFAI